MKEYTEAELLEIVETDPSPPRRRIAGQMLVVLGKQQMLAEMQQPIYRAIEGAACAATA